MASRALIARFRIADSSWPGSAKAGHGRAQRDADLDVLAQGAPEHALHRIDQAVAVDLRGLQHLASAEREQPARQLGAALARGRDHVGGLLEVGAGV
jgi:hypothetical protein